MQNTRIYVIYFVSLIHLFKGSDATFLAQGIIQLQNSSNTISEDRLHPMKKVVPDDLVYYEFYINVTDAETVDSIELVIKGSSMQFVKNMPEDILHVEWYDVYGNESITKMSVSLESNNTTLRARASNNGFPITSMYGTYFMAVKDQNSERLTVGNSMEIHALSTEGTITDPSIILSEPLLLTIPEIVVSSANPQKIGLKESTTSLITLLIPKCRLINSYVKVILPFNDKLSEAQMTYKKLKLLSATGIKDTKDSGVRKIKISTISKTYTSEKNGAIMDFPYLEIAPTNADDQIANVVVEATATLQDFKGYYDGMQLDFGFGFKVNEDVIWVGRSKVTITESNMTSLVPNLEMSFAESRDYRNKDKLTTKLRINLSHTKKSMASAYNVTSVLYFPPYIKIGRPVKAYDALRPLHVNIEDNTIEVGMDRISFPMNTRYVFNVSLITTNELFLRAETYNVVYEVIYNGWRNSTEYSQPLKMHHLSIDKDEILHDRYGDDLDCSCPFDSEEKSCACCHYGGCFCGLENPYKCVECNNIWSCMETLPGYYGTSMLRDREGNIFTCEGRQNMRPGRPYVSCFKEGNGISIALSPLIGVILGMNKESGAIFGINNNGLGYVASEDGGESWTSISENLCFDARQNETFINATIRYT